MTIENLKRDPSEQGLAETVANPELARKQMAQAESDRLLIAESSAADKAKAGQTGEVFRSLTKGATQESVIKKYREIQERKGVIFDQRA